MAKKKTVWRQWFNWQDEDAVVALLKQAWSIDASPQECQLHANISKDSYYRYLEAHPALRDESERLRNRPMLKARHELVKGLNNFDNALKYAKNKRNKEFNERTIEDWKKEIEFSVKDIEKASDEDLQKMLEE